MNAGSSLFPQGPSGWSVKLLVIILPPLVSGAVGVYAGAQVLDQRITAVERQVVAHVDVDAHAGTARDVAALRERIGGLSRESTLQQEGIRRELTEIKGALTALGDRLDRRWGRGR